MSNRTAVEAAASKQFETFIVLIIILGFIPSQKAKVVWKHH